MLGRVPPPAADWIGRRLGDVAWAALPRRRRLALANLAIAFPVLTHRERARLARQSFEHFGVTTMELCALLRASSARLLDGIAIDGRHHVDEAFATHGRALILTAHLGNWELLGLAHRAVGRSLAVVARPLDAPGLNAVVERLRSEAGIEIIAKQRALRQVLDALKRGRLVAILLDQNATRRDGVFVPFFGRAASTSRSIATLALRTKTPILPVFIRREGRARHRVTIHAPIIPPQAHDLDTAITELTARCTAAIEAEIRRTPEQWLWFHDRWRTRPTAERTPGAG